jgi:hypothetical protein
MCIMTFMCMVGIIVSVCRSVLLCVLLHSKCLHMCVFVCVCCVQVKTGTNRPTVHDETS